MTATALLLSLVLAGAAGAAPVSDRPVPQLATDGAFRQELARPLTATWANVPLRTVLRRISETRHISILLDRRIDPTRRMLVDVTGKSLSSALADIAGQADAQATVVGNTVYIGPPESTAKLRTLVTLRSEELLRRRSVLSDRRFKKLADGRTVHWNDLDRPADVLAEIGARYDLKIDGLEPIPHDLWAAAALPDATAAEALSLVLIQFDLGFRWTRRASAVRLIPVPETVAIERTYRPHNMTAAEAAEKWTAEIDGLRATAVGKNVRVIGTVEQHEAVLALSRPQGRQRSSGSSKPDTIPVSERSFKKLRFEGVPAQALIQKLQETGIEFRYDAARLEQAGVDLDTRLSMDLKDVSAEDVLREMCKPLGLRFTVDGIIVTLEPK